LLDHAAALEPEARQNGPAVTDTGAASRPTG
jgi:hypothetical protein